MAASSRVAVRSEPVGQRLEKGDARADRQLGILGENFAGERDARCLAAAGQQFLAQIDQVFRTRGRIAAAVARAIEQRPAAVGDAVEHLAEEGRVHRQTDIPPIES